MYPYLKDTDFLSKIDKMKIRTQYAKLILLSFDEKPIKEIQGNIISGSISVNGAAAIRRTLSLSMRIKNQYRIEDINSDISINKKIKVEIGYDNPFDEYDDIIWFPCGTYILSSANSSVTTNGYTVSFTAKDKMVMLDGSVGGTLPACVTFHEIYEETENNDIIITSTPTIYQIIKEAVNHYGGENYNNIIINDIDTTARILVRYTGDDPLYISEDYTMVTSSLTIAQSWTQSYLTFHNLEDIGYKFTDFTYPGELILNAGETVVNLLDKIKNTLGNYEYFYDLDGNFVFQEIKNYLNTTTNIVNLTDADYIKNYHKEKYAYSITDNETNLSISQNPKYDNIKNDFIVWGVRTTSSNLEVPICYRLVIDEKPIIDLANKFMWEIKQEGKVVRYEYTDTQTPPNANTGITVTLIGKKSTEWREELYRQALNTNIAGGAAGAYDAELLAYWRELYDTMETDWTNGWCPDVTDNPGSLNYWLDFIDSNSEVGKYSVNQIGRRTKVLNDKNIKTLYNKSVQDVMLIENSDEAFSQLCEWLRLDVIDDMTTKEKRAIVTEYLASIGQDYCLVTETYNNLLESSSTTTSAFEAIRELIYQYLSYNTTISISCLPKYYLEPNTLIYVQDEKTGINGNYVITQFNLPLTFNGTMNITATEALVRI